MSGRRFRERSTGELFREAEVGKDEMTGLVEEDVFGLKVSVDNLWNGRRSVKINSCFGGRMKEESRRWLTPAACNPWTPSTISAA
jgi:hypothetical protein